MPSIDEMRDGVEWVKAELRAIDAAAGDAPLDAETEVRFQAGLEYVKTTEGAIAQVEARRAEITARAAANPHHVVAGSQPAEVRDAGFAVNTRTNPFDLSDLPTGEARSSELRARALDVIEKHVPSYMPDSVREGATRTAEQRSTRQFDADAVRAAIIETTSPEYLRAFEDHLRNPQAATRLGEFRAAMSLTAANGGYLVPQFLDPTIVLSNAGTANDIRRISSVRQITVDQWDGVTSAGVTAEWLAENTEAADATPTFQGPTITAHKAAAYLEGSYEVIADSGFDEVGMLIGDAFDRLEAAAFTNGTGSGQPYGLITRLSGTGPVVAGTSGAAGAADFVVADIYALDDALGARWRQNASFLAPKSIYNDIRQMGTSNSYHAFWVSLGAGQPPELIGYPAYNAEDMDSGGTIVSGSNDYVLLLGDVQQYRVIDRIGTSIQFVPVVFGTSGGRPKGTAGWFAMKRTGADVLTSNAFKLLKV